MSLRIYRLYRIRLRLKTPCAPVSPAATEQKMKRRREEEMKLGIRSWGGICQSRIGRLAGRQDSMQHVMMRKLNMHIICLTTVRDTHTALSLKLSDTLTMTPASASTSTSPSCPQTSADGEDDPSRSASSSEEEADRSRRSVSLTVQSASVSVSASESEDMLLMRDLPLLVIAFIGDLWLPDGGRDQRRGGGEGGGEGKEEGRGRRRV